MRPRPPDSLRRLLRDRRGATAVIFALALPALALLTCGAIDLASVNGDHHAMQDAADATALAMAKQLGVATAAGITSRAQAYAAGQLGQVATNDGVTVTTSIAADNSSVTVTIQGARPSFFGNLFPPGGWTLTAQATASVMGSLPLCVLSSASGATGDISMIGSSQMSAAGCLVQANGDLTVNNGASLAAGLAQASGTASGPITPSPQSGAPTIADPFASLNIAPPPLGLCDPLDLVFDLGVNLLTPGVHCGNLTVRNGATVQLLPGEYYFEQGTLTLENNATLTGSNVVLIFNDDASFVFKDHSTINLTGRQSGTYAGFVIATTRSNTNTFAISSDAAHTLEGAVYIPDAPLTITGNGNKVADQSAWTVIVAQSLQMQGSPSLVVNANYASSSVPAPAGAGNNYSSGKVELSK